MGDVLSQTRRACEVPACWTLRCDLLAGAAFGYRRLGLAFRNHSMLPEYVH